MPISMPKAQEPSGAAAAGESGPNLESTLDALRAARPTLWTGRRTAHAEPCTDISEADVMSARARFLRFAPLLARLFPEVAATEGRIESDLLEVPGLQGRLGIPRELGMLLVKADHALPLAGSIKARGGFHEVLEYAESVAHRHGLLTGGDLAQLASPEARAVFGAYEISVGSTGNLGLAIGVMASALGFRAVVHMSSDAKQWKKERLRSRSVKVVEHTGDYALAVAAGRREAAENPRVHFVDDEQSLSLLLGYAAAARHLAWQLEELGRAVDAEHPLFVYLPCGVGGAPGGIALGLHQIFGPHVHCFFAEPVQAPCFLLQMLVESRELIGLGANPSIYDIGLHNRTEADGLAVPRASELAARAVKGFISGVYTVEDRTLFGHLHDAFTSEGIHIEPSAAAGFSGPRQLLYTSAGREYLQRQALLPHMSRSTHIAWTTGGLFVPEEEHERFLALAAAQQG